MDARSVCGNGEQCLVLANSNHYLRVTTVGAVCSESVDACSVRGFIWSADRALSTRASAWLVGPGVEPGNLESSPDRGRDVDELHVQLEVSEAGLALA